jgi:hypothetical protein
MFAQVAIGQWREHLPYRQGISVAYAGNKTFCATESGLYSTDKEDNTLERLSKINGLSDVGFSALAYDKTTNTLIIAYSNTNIDLLQDNTIYNLPDIKNKPILGNKTINNIHVENGIAYLACGFGIVVLDLLKQEVEDTYYIGDNGAQVFVNDLDINDELIFAATNEGLYTASSASIFLANYQEWSLDSTLPIANYNTIATLGNKVMINRKVEAHDTLLWKDFGPWNYYDTTTFALVRSLEAMNGAFTISSNREIDAIDVNFNSLWHTGGYPTLDRGCRPSQIVYDPDGSLWVADFEMGLVKISGDYFCEHFAINGPFSIGASDIHVWDGRLFVAAGSISSSWGNTYSLSGIFQFKDESWSRIYSETVPELGLFYDVARVRVNPQDSRISYASTWGTGLVELNDGVPVAIYNALNSPLLPTPGSENNVRIVGMEFDLDGNLWVSGSETGDNLLYCKTPGGEWHSFYFGSIAPTYSTFGDIVVDDIGQKWIIGHRGVGLIVFNDGGTLANTGDDQMKKLTQSLGNGNLASNDINSIAKDLDGEIWVGTTNGISVFYSPESVFEEGDFDSQQILVEQDGYVQQLLENETVTDIVVDGANQKWIGTASAGVFLMSDDGTDEIHHFTTENSPLFSDAIISIGVDHLTGEVFIGTDKGLMSYRGSATYGGNATEDYAVVAFPNPVEPNYDGPIAIRGLVRDSDIKISDVAGNVVYATTAEGGTAVWNGRNPGGTRAKSGVYLVFASNKDGKEALVTKILLVN